MHGIDICLEMLANFGVRYIFGNPGTSELPLMDALVNHERLAYILGLQEIPVMGIADGYAQASGQLGVVNLHISCGLGNAMGQLYNAYRENTPLLVTAGQQDRRLIFEEPILWGELVEVVRPWTKAAIEVHRCEDLPRAMCRAVQAALTPPTGPVFLSLPMDLQMEWVARSELRAIQLPDARLRPPAAAIEAAATLLVGAQRPAILAGSRVVQRGAIEQLTDLAEAIGAVAFTETISNQGRLGFPCDHPLAAHGLPTWGPEIRACLAPYDVILAVGLDMFRQYVYHDAAGVLPDAAQLIHLDENPRELGKNYALAVGLWGDTATGLQELATSVRARQSTADRERAAQRVQAAAADQAARRTALQSQLVALSAHRPLAPGQLMHCVAEALTPDVAVVEAAVTTTQGILERLGKLKFTAGYFGQRGWTLGWGLNVAIGVKLAWPDRPVLGLIGDGAALYGIQGLWTAAHYQLPVTWLICNNSQYKILKTGAVGLGLPQACAGRFLELDLTRPAIDFVQLAESFGVHAQRLTEPDEIVTALRHSWAATEPQLIEVPISE